MFLYVEKYRPHTIRDCILPSRIKNTLQAYVDQKRIPNLLFEGPPGTGKTTAARAMCEEIGVTWHQINSSSQRGIDAIRTEIVSFASTISLEGRQKVIIMDEADFLTPEAQAAFRGVIEQFSSNCTFILTCNFKAKLMDAIESRMATVSFKFLPNEKAKLGAEMFERAKQILKTENISFKDNVLAEIVMKYFPDFRKTLGELQRFSSYGIIDETVLAQLSSLKNIKELADHMKNKNFVGVRKWVVENADSDPNTIYRKLYDSLKDIIKPISVPNAIVIIAKYQYQHAFAADPEINLVAALVELMMESEFNA